MPDTATLPTLQYAGLPAQWGVSVEQEPAFVRVVVQPQGWRSIHIGYITGLLLLSLQTVISVSVVLMEKPVEWGALASASLYLIPIAAILAVVWMRARQRLVFMVTADRLVYAALWPSGNGRITSWPLASLAGVAFGPDGKRLIVRQPGRDTIELHVSPHADVAKYVVDLIAAAVAHPPVEPSNVDALLPMPRRRRSPRRAVLAFCAFIGIAVVALTIRWPEGIGAWVYLFILAAIPAGIVFGTQPKKFWL